MKKRLVILIFSLGLVGSCIACWIARGFYDYLFMWNGHIHVVSHLAHDQTVTLRFPSGETRKIELKANGSEDFYISKTGEGSIHVMIDGELVDLVGYVTTMNSPIVLCIDEDKVSFSQIFYRNTEPVAGGDAAR